MIFDSDSARRIAEAVRRVEQQSRDGGEFLLDGEVGRPHQSLWVRPVRIDTATGLTYGKVIHRVAGEWVDSSDEELVVFSVTGLSLTLNKPTLARFAEVDDSGRNVLAAFPLPTGPLLLEVVTRCRVDVARFPYGGGRYYYDLDERPYTGTGTAPPGYGDGDHAFWVYGYKEKRLPNGYALAFVDKVNGVVGGPPAGACDGDGYGTGPYAGSYPSYGYGGFLIPELWEVPLRQVSTAKGRKLKLGQVVESYLAESGDHYWTTDAGTYLEDANCVTIDGVERLVKDFSE